MNDDDFYKFLRDYTYQRSVDPKLSTQDIYNQLTQLQDHIRKKKDMAYSYSRGNWYQDTRGDEVATAVLEAYAKGIDFETLLKKNIQVRAYWKEIQDKKVKQAQARAMQAERDRKLAEKRAAEKAKREEVMTKLTPEELEAFGLAKKGKR